MRRYLGNVARILLVCLALGIFLLGLKAVAYNGYLASGEWREDSLIWLIVSVALSFLSPALERIRFERKHSD
jgi:uncharacterized RDD family membrane protein YckC